MDRAPPHNDIHLSRYSIPVLATALMQVSSEPARRSAFHSRAVVSVLAVMIVCPSGVAVIAVLTGIASLILAIWSWVRAGPVVRVTPRIPLPNNDFPPGDLPVEVRATNRGRAPVTVTDWGYIAKNGRVARRIKGLPPSVDLPHRLEPGAEASWYLPRHQAINLCHDLLENAHQGVHAFIALGGDHSGQGQGERTRRSGEHAWHSTSQPVGRGRRPDGGSMRDTAGR